MTWTYTEGLNYECACETLNLVMALYSQAIRDEEQKAYPDAQRLASLQAERRRLVAERGALSVTDQAGLQRAVDQYAPFVREHLPTGLRST